VPLGAIQSGVALRLPPHSIKESEKMIPAPFDYIAPATLDEALLQLTQNSDDAKILAGGHSLIPAMKLRLAQPQILIDIGRVWRHSVRR